jgi:hypothetical protein
MRQEHRHAVVPPTADRRAATHGTSTASQSPSSSGHQGTTYPPRRAAATSGQHGSPGEMTFVRWFLDVDGTISPYGLTEKWTGLTLYSESQRSDLAVPYRPDIIEGIQRLRDKQVLDIVWLTTWDEDELAMWSRAGLGPFPSVRRKAGRGQWWKARAVRTWMHKHPFGRVVWTDDDITANGLQGLDRTRLLAIAPDPKSGLRAKDLVRIERWARL